MRYWIQWLCLVVLFMVVAIVARHAGPIEAFVDGVLLATVFTLVFRWRDRFRWHER